MCALFRKIFDVPKPSRKRPGPAASWTTRASIATWTGWRVNGEMIPQPIVSRSRLPRHQRRDDRRGARLHPVLAPPGIGLGQPDRVHAGLVQTRADSSISSSGSIVSCMTPIRNGGDMRRSSHGPNARGRCDLVASRERMGRSVWISGVLCQKPALDARWRSKKGAHMEVASARARLVDFADNGASWPSPPFRGARSGGVELRGGPAGADPRHHSVRGRRRPGERPGGRVWGPEDSRSSSAGQTAIP